MPEPCPAWKTGKPRSPKLVIIGPARPTLRQSPYLSAARHAEEGSASRSPVTPPTGTASRSRLGRVHRLPPGEDQAARPVAARSSRAE